LKPVSFFVSIFYDKDLNFFFFFNGEYAHRSLFINYNSILLHFLKEIQFFSSLSLENTKIVSNRLNCHHGYKDILVNYKYFILYLIQIGFPLTPFLPWGERALLSETLIL